MIAARHHLPDGARANQPAAVIPIWSHRDPPDLVPSVVRPVGPEQVASLEREVASLRTLCSRLTALLEEAQAARDGSLALLQEAGLALQHCAGALVPPPDHMG